MVIYSRGKTMTAQGNAHNKHEDTAADSEDKQRNTSKQNLEHNNKLNGLRDMSDKKATVILKDISKNRENR